MINGKDHSMEIALIENAAKTICRVLAGSWQQKKCCNMKLRTTLIAGMNEILSRILYTRARKIHPYLCTPLEVGREGFTVLSPA